MTEEQTAMPDALLPFQDWNEKNPNDGKEPLAKYRGYSDYIKQETLAQGRYSDTFSQKVDQNLSQLAIDAGDYTLEDPNTEVTPQTVLARPQSDEIPLDALTRYAFSLETADDDPLRQATARLAAARGLADRGQTGIETVATAEADLRSLATPEILNAATRRDVKDGNSLAAVIPPAEPGGAPDVYVNRSLLEFVNPEDGSIDQAGLGRAAKLKGMDPSLIPAVLAKLSRPEGYGVSTMEMEIHGDDLAKFDTLARTRNAEGQYPLFDELQKAGNAIDAGNDAYLTDFGNFRIRSALREAGVDMTEAEVETLTRDFHAMNSMPEIDENDPAAALRTLSTGRVVAPLNLMLDDVKFETALKSVPLAQREHLKASRDYAVATSAAGTIEVLADSPEYGEAFTEYLDTQRAAGKTDAEITKGWIAKGEFNVTRSTFGGWRSSLGEAIMPFVYLATGADPDGFAMRAMIGAQIEDSNRRTYANLFGHEHGVGYDLGKLVAPVAVDLGAAFLTRGASVAATTGLKVTAGTAVRGMLRTALTAETRSLTQSWLRSGATSLAKSAAKDAGVKFTGRETVKDLISMAGRDITSKFATGTAYATSIATGFTRSATSTYASLSTALSNQTNPDGSPKYSAEEVKEIAMTHTLAGGTITVAVMSGMTVLGKTGLEKVLARGGMSAGQTARVMGRLKKDIGRLPGEIDTTSANSMISSFVREGVKPLFKGEVAEGIRDEAIEEGLDQFMQYFNEAYATGDRISILDAAKQALYAGTLGGIMGGTATSISGAVKNRTTPPAQIEAEIRRERLLTMAGELEATSPQTAQVFRNYAFAQKQFIPARQNLEADLKAAKTPEAKAAIQTKIDTLNEQSTRDPREKLAPTPNPEESIPEAAPEGGTVPQGGDEGVASGGTPETGAAPQKTVADAPARRGMPGGFTESDVARRMRQPATRETVETEFAELVEEPVQETQETITRSDKPSHETTVPKDTRSDERKLTGREATSWVLRDKTTKEVVMETYDRKKVDALNTEKYEAVPIGEYLASLNKPKSPSPSDTLPGLAMPPRKRSLSSMRDATVNKLDALDRKLARESDEDNIGVLEASKQRLTELLGRIENVMLAEAKEAGTRAYSESGEVRPSADPADVVAIAEAQDVPVADVVKPKAVASKTATQTPDAAAEILKRRGFNPAAKRKSKTQKPITVKTNSFTGNTVFIPPVPSDVTSREVIMVDSRGNQTSLDLRSLRGAAGAAEMAGQDTSLAGGREIDIPAAVQTVVVIDTNPKRGNLAGPDFAKVWNRTPAALEAPTTDLAPGTPITFTSATVPGFTEPTQGTVDRVENGKVFARVGKTVVPGVSVVGSTPTIKSDPRDITYEKLLTKGTPAPRLSEGATQTIIQTRSIRNFSGPSNAGTRAAIMSEIAGKEVPKSKAGLHAFVDVVATHFGVSKEGKTTNTYEKDIIQAVKDSVLPITTPDTSYATQEASAPATETPERIAEMRGRGMSVSVATTEYSAAVKEGDPEQIAYWDKVLRGLLRDTETATPASPEPVIADILADVPEGYPLDREASKLVATAAVMPGGLASAMHSNPDAADAVRTYAASKGIATDGMNVTDLATVVGGEIDADPVFAELRGETRPSAITNYGYEAEGRKYVHPKNTPPTDTPRTSADTINELSDDTLEQIKNDNGKGDMTNTEFRKWWAEQLSDTPRNLPSTTSSTAVTNELNSFGFSEGLPTFLANVSKKGGKQYAPVAKLLLEAGAGNVDIRTVNLPNTEAAGFYVGANGVVHINTAKSGPRGAVDTVLHELVHAVTEGSLKNPTPAQAKVIARIERVRQTVTKRAKANGSYDSDLQYALGDNAEFLTHFFTSQRFRDQVAAMTPKSEKNWIQVIADLIADLFTGRTRAQKLTDSLRKDLTTLITAPRIGIAPSDHIMRLPSRGSVELNNAFNNEIGKYITGNWPQNNPAARAEEAKRFGKEWLARSEESAGRLGWVLRNIPISPSTLLAKHHTYGGTGTPVTLEIHDSVFVGAAIDFLNEAEAKQYIARTVEEELIHASHIESQKRKLDADPYTLDNMLTDTLRVFDSVAAKNPALLETSLAAYTGRETPKLIEEFTLPEQAATVGEFIRQIAQLRRSGDITETAAETATNKPAEWVAAYRDTLDFAAQNLDNSFAKDIAETEAVMRDIRFQPTSDARNVARFHQLTESLYRGRDSATAAEIETWKAANPEAWEELSRMREEVLKAGGWGVKAYKGMRKFDWETGEEITSLNSKNGPWAGFLSSDRDVAEGFIRWIKIMSKPSADTLLLDAFLRMDNALTVDANGAPAADFQIDVNFKDPATYEGVQREIRDAVEQGRPVIIRNTSDEADIYIAAQPEHVKSSAPVSAGIRVTPDQWADAGSSDIRFQPSTVPSDSAYLAAVEEGDMETAQMMVDEAAKRAGYDVKAYHGTASDFNVFDPDKQTNTAHGHGFYFAEDKSTAEGYAPENGRVVRARLNLKNPLRGDIPTFPKADLKRIIKKIIEIEVDKYPGEISSYRDSFLSNFTDTYSKTENQAIEEAIDILQGNETAIDQINELSNVIGDRTTVHEAVRDAIGHDGILVENFQETGDKVYVAWLPSQIKSADPVTYDKKGNVIPLSQRFQTESTDIRFQPSVESGETPTYEVYDRQTGEVVWEGKRRDIARQVQDRRDNAYGGYRFAVREVKSETRLQPALTETDFTPANLRDTASGFLPEDVTLDDLNIDFTDLEDVIEGLDPVNAENSVHAAVNHALARRAGEAAIPAPARSEFDSDAAHEAAMREHAAEVKRLTDTYELITRGRLTSDAMLRYRTNPSALTRLIDYLTAAIKAAYKRFTSRYDVGTAVALNRMSRDLAKARTGFNHDIEPSRGFDPDEEVRFQFAGENANTPQFMRDSLDTAKAMAAAGKPSEEIRALTGWFPGKYDGKMRWEIPDVGAKLVDGKTYAAMATETYGGEVFNNLPMRSALDRINEGKVLRLKDVMNHPELYAAYPEAAEIPFFPIGGNVVNGSLRTVEGKKLITATLTTDNGQLSEQSRSVILHEVQHFIQDAEGFAKGGSPNGLISASDITDAAKFKDADGLLKKYKTQLRSLADTLAEERGKKKGFMGFGGPDGKAIESLEAEVAKITDAVNSLWAYQEKNLSIDRDSARASLLSAINEVDNKLGSNWVMSKRNEGLNMLYKSIAGEIEARDIQARANLTPEQLKATAPYSSENIAPEDAIVLNDSTSAASIRFLPAAPQNTARIEKQLLNGGAWVRRLQGLFKVDPSTKASADVAPSENVVLRRLREFFINSDGALATSNSKSLKNRNAGMAAIAKTIFNATKDLDAARVKEDADHTLVKLALGNENPMLPQAAQDKIIEDFENEIAKAEEAFENSESATAEEAWDALAEAKRIADVNRKKAIWMAQSAEADLRREQQLESLAILERTAPDTFEAIIDIRGAVNELQRLVKEVNRDSPELQAIIDQSMGVYLVRSMGIYQDPKQIDLMIHSKDPKYEQRRDALVAFFRPKAYEAIVEELGRDPGTYKAYGKDADYAKVKRDIEARAKNLADERAFEMFEDYMLSHETPKGAFSEGSTVTNEIQRYMKKENMPQEFLDALMVNEDPVFNIAHTAMSLGRLVWNSRMLTEIYESGIESGRFITQAEKDSGITYADGKEEMRRVFGIDGEFDEIKNHVLSTLTTLISNNAYEQYNNGRIDTKPDFEEMSAQAKAAMKAFASSPNVSLADALPQLGRKADRLVTDAFISYKFIPSEIRTRLNPKRGRFSTYDALVSENTGNSAFKPLGGLFASPEQVNAFNATFKINAKGAGHFADTAMAQTHRFIVGAAGLSLAVVTQGNPAFFIRNVVGNPFIAAMSGVTFFDPKKLDLAARTFKGIISNSGKVTEEIQELIAARIINDGAHIGYMKQLFEDVTGDTIGTMENLAGEYARADIKMGELAKGSKKAAKAFLDRLSQFSEASESLSAVMVYLDFKNILTEADWGTETEIIQQASLLSKRVLPSRSEAPSGVNAFTRSGFGALFSPFLRFRVDVIRSAVGALQVAHEWSRSDNPVLKKHGRIKMASWYGTVGLLTVGLPLIFQRALGFDDEDDKYVRAFLPEYYRDSSLLYMRTQDGKGIHTASISYLNPLASAGDPLSRIANSLIAGNPSEIPGIMGRFITQEVAGENIVAGSIIDWKRNIDPRTGMPIYLETESTTDKALKVATHIGQAYLPKFISQNYKLYKTLQRESKQEGWNSPTGVAFSLVAPLKAYTTSFDDADMRIFRSIHRDTRELSSITYPIFSPYPTNKGDVEDAYMKRMNMRIEQGERLRRLGETSAKISGRPMRDVERNMIAAGNSKKSVHNIMRRGVVEKLVFAREQEQKMIAADPSRLPELRRVQSTMPSKVPVMDK